VEEQLMIASAGPAEARGPRRAVTSLAGLLLRRFASAVAVLWGAVTVTFVALHLTPGSTIDSIVGQAVVSPQVRAQIVSDYGLNQPLVVQYLRYLGNLARGDLGQSYNQGLPVATAIGQQVGSTLLLVAVGVGLALGGSVIVALLTVNRPRWLGGPAAALEMIGVAIPSFWLGILLLTLFSFRLHWFTAIGSNTPAGLLLPAISLAVAPGAMLAQVLRQALEKTLDEPFIITARARGIGQAAVLVRHALRPALLPVITLTGWLVASFMGGAVVTETVFSRPGLGRLTVTAIEQKDFPLVSGIVLLSATSYVLIGFLVDAIYPVLDPRLRTPGGQVAEAR
jgi:peptide/nickel transport system permease protein